MFIKKKQSLKDTFAHSRWIRWALMLLVTLAFVLMLYPDLFVEKEAYRLGDVVERDIKAPKDFFIENKRANAVARKKAIEGVRTVYDHDVTLLPKIRKGVHEAFAEVRKAVDRKKEDQSLDIIPGPPATIEMEKDHQAAVHEMIWQLKPVFEEKLGIPVSNGAYNILQSEGFSEDVADLIDQILTTILTNGVVANKEVLLRESKKGITLRDVSTQSETEVMAIKRFYGSDQAQAMVRVVGNPLLKDTAYSLRNLIVDFVQVLIQPNITLNRNETEKRKKTALAAIKPVLYKIKAGEMLLREGERVTQVQLLKLNALQSITNRKKIIASGLGAAIIVAALLVVTYVLQCTRWGRFQPISNKNLLFLATFMVSFLLLGRVWLSLAEAFVRNSGSPLTLSQMAIGIPIASGAMVVCLLLGMRAAISFNALIAVTTAILCQNRLDLFIYFFISGAMATYWIQHCRERKVFIKAGLKLALLNVALATAIHAYWGNLSASQLMWGWLFGVVSGVGAGIVTAGLVPLFEVAFGYTTDIKLLELANLDQPILRRLMLEAPGTYHHSVIVGSLVEAAAAAIGANPLLAKVCGYYHDIGKLKMPLYFIENQSNGINKHDKLNPSMSKRILIAHIKDGVEFARKNRLGQTIIDTIVQHHGNCVIRYFYEKAKNKKNEDVVEIDDYRYPGPRPQTREAGLVMLADIVEAASRTLANPTPSRIQGLVQNLINKMFSDGQLDNCELTLKDLHKIAKSFNQILNGIHHHRIEYPDQIQEAEGRGKNGSSDRQSTKKVQNLPQPRSPNREGHLRRLGLP